MIRIWSAQGCSWNGKKLNSVNLRKNQNVFFVKNQMGPVGTKQSILKCQREWQ